MDCNWAVMVPPNDGDFSRGGWGGPGGWARASQSQGQIFPQIASIVSTISRTHEGPRRKLPPNLRPGCSLIASHQGPMSILTVLLCYFPGFRSVFVSFVACGIFAKDRKNHAVFLTSIRNVK